MPLTTDYNCQFACVIADDCADIIGCVKLSNLVPEVFLWQVDCLKGKIKALQAELDMAKSDTITAADLNEELNAEVRERCPPGEDQGRIVLVPEKQFRAMRGAEMLEAIRRGNFTYEVPAVITVSGEEDTYTIVEGKK